jgi:hypothetical protein
MKSPIPLADQISGIGHGDPGSCRRRPAFAVGDGFSRMVGGVLDLMPRRRTNYKRVGARRPTKRETQRRAAIAILAFIAVVAVLGVAVVVLDPFRQEAPISNVTEGEAASATPRTRPTRCSAQPT